MDLTRQFAHELQAPLLSLELQLQRLLEQIQDQDLARSCLDEVAALKHLVSHTLELAAPALARQPLELAPILERLAQRFRPIAEARGVDLSIKTDPESCFADASATERILSNLIDNAIKFSDPGGRVELTTRTSGDTVELEVRDEGVGIAEDARERIFEPFYRVNRELSGAGLGLAISTQLARAQRGTLQLMRGTDRGSTFVLTLPATPP